MTLEQGVQHFRQYLEYIQNTGRRPLSTAMFDEDWDPIGPTLRKDMETAGLIEQSIGALMITIEAERVMEGRA